MNEFCKKVKEEITPLLTPYNEHWKYLGNKEEVDYKDDLRKRFIKKGHITDPQKDYNFEISIKTETERDKVIEELNFFGVQPKNKIRGKKFLVYCKDAESISTLLSVIGAVRSMMEFENVRIEKQVSSDENRRVNFEVANIKKTVSAGLKQEELIKKLFQKIPEEKLPPKILELCDARRKNPDKSFEELAKIIPNSSKSKINHLFRKMKELVKEKEIFMEENVNEKEECRI